MLTYRLYEIHRRMYEVLLIPKATDRNDIHSVLTML